MYDNISSRYQALKQKPGAIENALSKFHIRTEETYKAFSEIVEEHSDIGKAAIIMMAVNNATHLVRISRDEDWDDNTIVTEIATMIAPMYELLYDKLVRETIDQMNFFA